MIQLSQQGRAFDHELRARAFAQQAVRRQPVEYGMKLFLNLPARSEMSRAAAFDLGGIDGSQLPGPIINVLKDKSMDGLKVRRVKVAGKRVCG